MTSSKSLEDAIPNLDIPRQILSFAASERKSLEDVILNRDIPKQTLSFAVSERKSLVGTLHSIVDVTIEMILRSLSSDERPLVMSLVRRNATFALTGLRWIVESI